MSLETIDCPLCGSARRTDLFTAVDHTYGNSGSWEIVRCSQCGLGYQNPRIPPSQIARYYPKTYYTRTAPDERIAPNERPGALDRMLRTYLRRRLIRPPAAGARLLDVGSGSGVTAAMYNELGWQAEGFDVDREAAAAAEARGVQVHVAPSLVAANLPAASFDAVTMWDSLEHIPDPVVQLREVVRLLCLDGTLHIGVPDLDSWPSRLFGAYWHHVDAPVHYTYWSARSLRVAAERLGLEAVAFEIPYTTACTRLSAQHLGGMAKTAASVFDRPWRVLDKVVRGGHVVATLKRRAEQ